jgi:hypothetical protein
VKKPRVALLYAPQFLDESREVARCAAINLNTHKAICYLNTRMNLSLSIAESLNIKLAFRGRSRTVRLAFACVMFNRSTA